MAGVDSRKEKRAAAARSKFLKRPAVSVMPLRDVPGTMASAWAAPITIASPKLSRPMSFVRFPSFSATSINTPTATNMLPMST